MLYFCRRGRQNLRQLKKSDFAVNTDSMGAKFVSKIADKLTENQTRETREDDESEEGGIMFATEDPFSPVASFEKCLSHLNQEN